MKVSISKHPNEINANIKCLIREPFCIVTYKAMNLVIEEIIPKTLG